MMLAIVGSSLNLLAAESNTCRIQDHFTHYYFPLWKTNNMTKLAHILKKGLWIFILKHDSHQTRCSVGVARASSTEIVTLLRKHCGERWLLCAESGNDFLVLLLNIHVVTFCVFFTFYFPLSWHLKSSSLSTLLRMPQCHLKKDTWSYKTGR